MASIPLSVSACTRMCPQGLLNVHHGLLENDLKAARRLVSGGSHGLEPFSQASRIGDHSSVRLSIASSQKGLFVKPLDGFEVSEFTDGDITHPVYVRGSGPGVLLLHELPGMVPQCVDLATFIAKQGFTVFMPLLFGEPGAPPATKSLTAHVCISREFHCFAHNKSSPVTRWLRALCVQRIRPNCPGPGIGAIGMCFTGGFVLSLFVSDMMLAPVICQPGLPFPSLKRGAGAALGVSPEDLEEASASTAPILGLRFDDDKICPKERFETLRTLFGSRFETPRVRGKEHSVLTLAFVDDPSHDTFKARARVIAFLEEQLGVPSPAARTEAD